MGGGGCDAVPSKTITSFLISSAESNTASGEIFLLLRCLLIIHIRQASIFIGAIGFVRGQKCY